MKIFKNLGVLVLVGMVLGAITGTIFGDKVEIIAPLGSIFMSLLILMVIPLVLFSVVSGTSSLGNGKAAQRIGARTLGFVACATLLAASMGAFFGNITGVGTGIDASVLTDNVEPVAAPGIWEMVQGFVPNNIMDAMSSGNIIHVLIFGVFFGLGINALPREKTESLRSTVDAGRDVMIWMIQKVMLLSPIGVFALIADAVGSHGLGLMTELLSFVGVLALVPLTFVFVVYPLVIKYGTNFTVAQYFRAVRQPALFAFSTCSSAATLPITMENVKKMGVKPSVLGFTVPLGCTINMAGTAALFSLSAVFSANIFGIDLGAAEYIAIILTTLLAAMGVAGVPGAALLTIPVMMAAGIPLAAIPLLLAIDRLNDMLCTGLNVSGDVCIAAFADKEEEVNVPAGAAQPA
ncbi:dicarboxylate/amino acid:cation symporter [Paraferrimonas sedimenticola]|uniref:Amino acid:proton symporter n=1 Tax=Paraferrimonas sedimenticola TaxID=375674 RepID=A0AA37RWC6_9GAMM|nr:dicarboxylate/amino acid:cation symporter [Paraferrimonas sedimenticola]GLP96501.1 amino acid:proton symporter [Paraferrimonas sedimenticola]